MKKRLLTVGVLSFTLSVTACQTIAIDPTSSGNESTQESPVSSEETTTGSSGMREETAASSAKESEETTADAAAADVDSKFIVPGYALGEFPVIPAVTIPGLGIYENPDSKITLDMTSPVTSLPGVNVTLVKVENGQIISGASTIQVDESGSGQYVDGNITIQTDGDGSGQYIDESRGITIQRNDDGSGQYIDTQKGISVQVNSDGSGQYSDNQNDIILQVSADGTGQYINNRQEIRIVVIDNTSRYTQGPVIIDNNGDGSGDYWNQSTGLEIENDGKGKATISLDGETITVDADPLLEPARLPLLKALPGMPSIEANSLLITLDSGALFDVDKYDIRPDAQETLNNLATILKQAEISAFEIDGHTDSDASDEHNLTLSINRANSVKSYLESQGVTATITTNGYGESRPVAPNDTPEGKQRNRRVEIIIPTV